MNAKRKWNMRTVLLGLIIAVIVITVVVVLFFSPSSESTNILTVQEVLQNGNKYVNETITVEGYYYQFEGPSLVSATTVSEPNPIQWLNLDETSFNSAIEAANITKNVNLKYRVVGVLEKVNSPIPSVFNFKIKVISIEAV